MDGTEVQDDLLSWADELERLRLIRDAAAEVVMEHFPKEHLRDECEWCDLFVALEAKGGH